MNRSLAIAKIVILELYRRKDVYVLFLLTALLTLLMGAVNFFNDDRIVRYLKEVCLLLIWISALIIAISTTARQIPSERENRTILPLLAKPVSRWEMIFGKFLGAWFASAAAVLLFYIFFCLMSGAREHSMHWLNYGQALWFHWVFLGVVVSMVLLGSIVFAAPSSNSTICFLLIAGILVLGRHLNVIALQQAEPMRSVIYAIYYMLPHVEFFDLRDLVIHSGPTVPWWALGLGTMYGVAYVGIFLAGSWMAFRKKAVN